MPIDIRFAGPPLQREPRRDVDAELRPLATYAAQRALQGRPLAPEALRTLRRADDTVRETRALLPLGRGNVDADIQRTDNESTCRTFMARRVARSIATLPPQPADAEARGDFIAAAAVVAGAGNCSEIAHIATRLHAGRLEAGRALQVMANVRDDHEWLEQVPAGGAPGPTVVIDPWMRGPAVLLQDANEIFTRDRQPLERLEADRAPGVREEFCSLVGVAAGCAPEIEAGVQALTDSRFRLDAALVRHEEDVTSAAFRHAAASAAARGPNPDLGAQLAIAAAARELGANVRGATAFAAGVTADLAQPPRR